MVEPFPLIEISGPPRERGRQYGQKAAERIRKGTSHYFAQLKALSLDSAGVSALVVQAGTTLSTRSRGETNAFNVLRVQPRHIEVERHAWSSGKFAFASVDRFDHTGEGWTRSAA